jgi:transcriptional regulator with XRE-family HTH domain
MEIEQRLAERVKRYRKARGWSQEELADRASLHRTFISQIERSTKRTTIKSVAKVAAALEVTFGQLLDEE